MPASDPESTVSPATLMHAYLYTPGGILEVVISSASSRGSAFLRASLQFPADESCSAGDCKLHNCS